MANPIPCHGLNIFKAPFPHENSSSRVSVILILILRQTHNMDESASFNIGYTMFYRYTNVIP